MGLETIKVLGVRFLITLERKFFSYSHNKSDVVVTPDLLYFAGSR